MLEKQSKKIPGRALAIIVIFFALWMVIVFRLFSLQVLNNDKYEANVIGNVERETDVTANRGIIYDSNMVPLATNQTTWRIFISPRDIEDDTQAALIASQLSDILDVDYGEILGKTEKIERADETIKKDITEEEYDKVVALIDEYDLDLQIHYEAYTKRYYPYDSLASHVIGCVGADSGQFGLELQYNTELTGVSGKYITARDAQGNRMPYKYDSYIEAQNGANLVTTIDTRIQSVLEEQLRQAYEDGNPLERVCGIVMDVNNGAILAMAVYPNFDLNDPYTLDGVSQSKLNNSGYAKDTDEYNKYYWDLIYNMWSNKAVSELYEPGSTFKVITTAMALEEKVTVFSDMYTCTGGMTIAGYPDPIHCHKRSGHGTVTYRVGLQQSCNPTLMQVAAKIGIPSFYDYFKAFGYTEKTGVDLPGEGQSLYEAYSSFSNVSLAVYSFGQTFKVTPLQQIRAICSVANGGNLVTPHLVSKIVDDDGNVISSFGMENIRQVVSKDVCKEISEVLEEGVSGDGGAKNAYVAGYKVAAKTGTSQKRDVRDSDEVVGSTVAYVPSDDPQIAILIMVDSPQLESRYGSVVAAPYVANTLKEILPTLGVERDESKISEQMKTVLITSYSGHDVNEAKRNIEEKGIACEIVGDQSTVVDQVPSAGAVVQQSNAKIVLYTVKDAEKTLSEVPDVTGISAEQANQILVSAGFNVEYDGAVNRSGASVTAQSYEAGEMIPYGSVVRITVRYFDGTE
ncbi:MAG: PASTA domain-containing protein [Ruminococcaceae bacterium]|nr:PASTA domain-containing protein [Oscillospiraceae bacterium]